ncbi:MAG: hypothetical protein UY39_C0018G0015 [Candidatus Kaiserbacteria bacterium GW2011_GWC2_49_12]|uniref:Uncharacterized protein n=1 Tax=Candidatus Kaiserbacteria bacterium GW2011_GWC2_49_12 TaxID=1618675 RepID=A0A0G1XX71_9BACT|nr:MAG: hypothetical protein UY39_C0018G0015 [Candidatus Kaiserbacteria bacterium GW2011_GWC2_49_12]
MDTRKAISTTYSPEARSLSEYLRSLPVVANSTDGILVKTGTSKQCTLSHGNVSLHLTAVIVKNGIRTEHPLKVGDTFIVHKGTAHRLISKRGGVVVEVAIGSTFNEEDIVRLEDDHGRTIT